MIEVGATNTSPAVSFEGISSQVRPTFHDGITLVMLQSDPWKPAMPLSCGVDEIVWFAPGRDHDGKLEERSGHLRAEMVTEILASDRFYEYKHRNNERRTHLWSYETIQEKYNSRESIYLGCREFPESSAVVHEISQTHDVAQRK